MRKSVRKKQIFINKKINDEREKTLYPGADDDQDSRSPGVK
jgi:hypothetical protein